MWDVGCQTVWEELEPPSQPWLLDKVINIFITLGNLVELQPNFFKRPPLHPISLRFNSLWSVRGQQKALRFFKGQQKMNKQIGIL